MGYPLAPGTLYRIYYVWAWHEWQDTPAAVPVPLMPCPYVAPDDVPKQMPVLQFLVVGSMR